MGVLHAAGLELPRSVGGWHAAAAAAAAATAVDSPASGSGGEARDGPPTTVSEGEASWSPIRGDAARGKGDQITPNC